MGFRGDASGFTLVEAIFGAALLGVVALASATVTSQLQNAAQVVAAQASNIALIDAVRTQLSRSATCLPSLVSRPSDLSNPSEIAVALGSSGTVRKGADLPAWKVVVQSLAVNNFSAAGASRAGNPIVLADVVISGQSRDSGSPFPMRQRVVMRLAFETQGGNIVDCYGDSALQDTFENLRQVCKTITSPDGVPGTWTGTACQTPDEKPSTTCGRFGGTWSSNRCYPSHAGTIVGMGVDFGNPGGVWYGKPCPAGSRVTSGTCLSGSGAPPPLNGMISGNGAYCEWPSGYESTQYDMWSVCTY